MQAERQDRDAENYRQNEERRTAAPVTYLDGLVLGAYYSVLAMLTLFALHRLSLVYLRRKHSQGIVPAPAAMSRFPSITVQLPLYNEPAVSVRALQAAAALCYQGDLRIQLLDDSTDETTALVAERAAQLQSEGIQIDHIRRQTRDGFKAGALSHGMRRSDSELFLVLDATSSQLSEKLFGKDREIKALLVSDRDAVTNVLLSCVS